MGIGTRFLGIERIGGQAAHAQSPGTIKMDINLPDAAYRVHKGMPFIYDHVHRASSRFYVAMSGDALGVR